MTRNFKRWFQDNELAIIDSLTVILVWAILILGFTALIYGTD